MTSILTRFLLRQPGYSSFTSQYFRFPPLNGHQITRAPLLLCDGGRGFIQGSAAPESVALQEVDSATVGEGVGATDAGGGHLPRQGSEQFPAGESLKPHSRVPGIQFPVRRSDSGEQLSSRVAPVYVTGAEYTSTTLASPRRILRSDHTNFKSPPKLRISISDAEMERIMLGGADP